MPKSNKERTEATRADLIAAARKLFIEKGYADTATPDIVAAAGVTRGALYHHFEDKRALFRAVVEREAHTVAADVEAASPDSLPPLEALIEGGEAYLAAMREPGRTRLLLLDGPAVLGRTDMDEIDSRHGTRSLKAGITFAVRVGAMPKSIPIDAVTALLSAAYDRAAIAVETGGNADDHRAAMEALLRGLLRQD
jgi:AcrR family transcriptional regulator